MTEDEPLFTNHLIGEKSPYLQQHAHNPIDWYPWGDAAFTASRMSDKPIFLSIGYATCHWCHVMEEESFSDPAVAKQMNEAFICIKVDREELPQVDGLYMEFAQTLIVGATGWPLNLILTPELKPFFASTYLPKHTSRGLVGMMELTDKISRLWQSEEREQLLQQAEKIVDILKNQTLSNGGSLPSYQPIRDTAEILFKIADPVYGGMRGAPKFPLGYQITFLLRYFQKTQDSRALFLVDKTLEMMHRGGIYDHLGWGFHRYAVDTHWHIPHFEKMLYDNALLAYAYLDAWKFTERPLYKQVCIEVLDYVLRDMQDPQGGFYSAEDADSQSVEGLYYTWTRNEVISLLDEELGGLFCELYGIFDHGMVEGRSVVRLGQYLEELATIKEIEPTALEASMIKARQTLYEERLKRPRPLRDDKVITSYNGLMIFSLCEAGVSLQNERFLQAAVKAAEFLKKELYKEGVLYRRYRDGETKGDATLEDYAFLIRALISLFEADQGSKWLEWALELAATLKEDFLSQDGAYFQASSDSEHLLYRKCHFADGAEPSGNAVQSENLMRLYQITGNSEFLIQAEDMFKAVSRFLAVYPLGYCYHLIALGRYFDKKKATCIIALNEKGEWEKEIKDALLERNEPHSVIIWKRPHDHYLKALFGKAHYEPVSNKTTLYICYEGVCKKPLSTLDEIVSAIRERL